MHDFFSISEIFIYWKENGNEKQKQKKIDVKAHACIYAIIGNVHLVVCVCADGINRHLTAAVLHDTFTYDTSVA